jgi:hypothetical protein
LLTGNEILLFGGRPVALRMKEINKITQLVTVGGNESKKNEIFFSEMGLKINIFQQNFASTNAKNKITPRISCSSSRTLKTSLQKSLQTLTINLF